MSAFIQHASSIKHSLHYNELTGAHTDAECGQCQRSQQEKLRPEGGRAGGGERPLNHLGPSPQLPDQAAEPQLDAQPEHAEERPQPAQVLRPLHHWLDANAQERPLPRGPPLPPPHAHEEESARLPVGHGAHARARVLQDLLQESVDAQAVAGEWPATVRARGGL